MTGHQEHWERNARQELQQRRQELTAAIGGLEATPRGTLAHVFISDEIERLKESVRQLEAILKPRESAA